MTNVLVGTQTRSAPANTSQRQREPLPQGRILVVNEQPYTILRSIHSGTDVSAELYLAEDNRRNPVVIKEVCTPETQLLLHNEATILQKLIGVPGQIQFVNYERKSQESYLVLEDLTSYHTLSGFVGGTLYGEEEVRKLFLKIAEAVEYLHNRGVPIVHRDLTPANIAFRIVNGEFVVKLLDFEISIEGSQIRLEGTCTTATLVGGTLDHSAPEAFSTPSPKSDVYSLGSILLQMSTGLSARDALDAERCCCVLPHSVPSSLRPIIEKSLEYKPMDRFASAKEMKQTLVCSALVPVGEQQVAETQDAHPSFFRRLNQRITNISVAVNRLVNLPDQWDGQGIWNVLNSLSTVGAVISVGVGSIGTLIGLDIPSLGFIATCATLLFTSISLLMYEPTRKLILEDILDTIPKKVWKKVSNFVKKHPWISIGIGSASTAGVIEYLFTHEPRNAALFSGAALVITYFTSLFWKKYLVSTERTSQIPQQPQLSPASIAAQARAAELQRNIDSLSQRAQATERSTAQLREEWEQQRTTIFRRTQADAQIDQAIDRLLLSMCEDSQAQSPRTLSEQELNQRLLGAYSILLSDFATGGEQATSRTLIRFASERFLPVSVLQGFEPFIAFLKQDQRYLPEFRDVQELPILEFNPANQNFAARVFTSLAAKLSLVYRNQGVQAADSLRSMFRHAYPNSEQVLGERLNSLFEGLAAEAREEEESVFSVNSYEVRRIHSEQGYRSAHNYVSGLPTTTASQRAAHERLNQLVRSLESEAATARNAEAQQRMDEQTRQRRADEARFNLTTANYLKLLKSVALGQIEQAHYDRIMKDLFTHLGFGRFAETPVQHRHLFRCIRSLVKALGDDKSFSNAAYRNLTARLRNSYIYVDSDTRQRLIGAIEHINSAPRTS